MKLRSKSVPPAVVPNRSTRSRKTLTIQSDIQSIDTKVIEPSAQRYLDRLMYKKYEPCVYFSFFHLLLRTQTRSKLFSSKIDDLKNKTEKNRNKTSSCENGVLSELDNVAPTLPKDKNRTKKRLRSNQISPVEISAGTSITCTQIANDEINQNGNVSKDKSTIKISVTILKDEICEKKRFRSEKHPPVGHQQDNNATVSSQSIKKWYNIFKKIYSFARLN